MGRPSLSPGVLVLVMAAAGVVLARPPDWNNVVRARVWEPSAEEPDETFQPELEELEDNFAADSEGMTVTIGQDHACVLERAGWGDGDGDGSAGEDGSEASIGGKVTCWHTGRDKHGLLRPPQGKFVQISAGDRHTCGVRLDGRLECWGEKGWEVRAPEGEFLQVSSGSDHACGVRKDGILVCFGMCGLGQCDVPSDGAPFVQVSASGHGTCALMSNGSAACFGMSANGRSGYGTHNVPAGVQFTQLSLSTARTACGLTVNSSMVCWGGIVAHPDDGQVYVRDATFAMVSAGHNVYCGLLADSTISCDGNVFHLSRDAKHMPDRHTEWVEITTRHSTICGVEFEAPHRVQCWGGKIAAAMPDRELNAAL